MPDCEVITKATTKTNAPFVSRAAKPVQRLCARFHTNVYVEDLAAQRTRGVGPTHQASATGNQETGAASYLVHTEAVATFTPRRRKDQRLDDARRSTQPAGNRWSRRVALQHVSDTTIRDWGVKDSG